MLGNGAGGFSANKDFPTGNSSASSVAIADANGDGRKDVVVGGSRVSILPGDGTGALPRALPTISVPDAGSLAVGDFNGDGKKDLATVAQYDNVAKVMLGDGKGGFGTPSDFVTGSSPYAVVAGDFNGDKKSDLAVVNHSSASVSILMNRGDGSFKPKVDYSVGRALLPRCRPALGSARPSRRT
jgi:hypothetical protein